MSETLYVDRINGSITATEDASGWYLLNAADVFIPPSAMDAIRKALADAEPLRAAQSAAEDEATHGTD